MRCADAICEEESPAGSGLSSSSRGRTAGIAESALPTAAGTSCPPRGSEDRGRECPVAVQCGEALGREGVGVPTRRRCLEGLERPLVRACGDGGGAVPRAPVDLAVAPPDKEEQQGTP
eukprot:CAMPEP_0175557092 /NCGR_PEP_ID=MMETSP0096-20121207/35198_1 /TAXON_ID=311494 /ORGANISM="Alexandrium monilatum, Strain CCMP3105" /LENGTH=117 /DNA_ID=CAMNT_0016860233 /DNA_START=127 /DNA_END=477 /DNA_ORIENTATION=+